MPDHWIQDFVRDFGKPVVTTSANVAGREFMTSLENLDPRIKMKLDFIIDEGEKRGTPSTLIDLTNEQEMVIAR